MAQAKKTYVIAHDDYMGEGYQMYSRECTYRQILEELNGIDDVNRKDPIFSDNEDEENQRCADDIPDHELEQLFNNANGDGQPYYMVWCVEDKKMVLPTSESEEL